MSWQYDVCMYIEVVPVAVMTQSYHWGEANIFVIHKTARVASQPPVQKKMIMQKWPEV